MRSMLIHIRVCSGHRMAEAGGGEKAVSRAFGNLQLGSNEKQLRFSRRKIRLRYKAKVLQQHGRYAASRRMSCNHHLNQLPILSFEYPAASAVAEADSRHWFMSPQCYTRNPRRRPVFHQSGVREDERYLSCCGSYSDLAAIRILDKGQTYQLYY